MLQGHAIVLLLLERLRAWQALERKTWQCYNLSDSAEYYCVQLTVGSKYLSIRICLFDDKKAQEGSRVVTRAMTDDCACKSGPVFASTF